MSEVQLSYSKLVQIARGLAQGVLEGKWGVNITDDSPINYIAQQIDLGSYSPTYELKEAGDSLVSVMDNESSSVFEQVERIRSILKAMGYVDGNILTSSAFELTRADATITIFVSYRRAESSLLALYLQSRFKIAGGEAFVDVNNLDLGDDWHPALEEKVKESAYFICLVGPTTLESQYVRQEIKWAIEANVRIIPVFHNGFNSSAELNKLLVEKHPFLATVTQKHGHVIKDAGDPNDYRNAADEILTSLGYAVL